MKIRNGFVSNSSSSSFVVIGFKIQVPKQKEDQNKLIDKLKPFSKNKNSNYEDLYDFLYDENFDGFEILTDSENDKFYLGKITADVKSDGDGLDYNSFDVDVDFIQNLLEIKKSLGIDKKVQIHTGTRLC